MHECAACVGGKTGDASNSRGRGERGGGLGFVLLLMCSPFMQKRCNRAALVTDTCSTHCPVGSPREADGWSLAVSPSGGAEGRASDWLPGPVGNLEGESGGALAWLAGSLKDLGLWSPKWPMIPIIESYPWTPAAALPRMTSVNCWWVRAVLARLNRVPLCFVSRKSEPPPCSPRLPGLSSPLGMTNSGCSRFSIWLTNTRLVGGIVFFF